MSKTREQLISQIAEELKILGSGQVLSIEDRAKIEDVIEPVMAELTTRDIIGGIDLSAIPLEFFIPLGQIIARHAAIPFGMTDQEMQVYVANAASAEARILAMTLPRATGQRAQPEYM
jgi:hypothetical protein